VFFEVFERISHGCSITIYLEHVKTDLINLSMAAKRRSTRPDSHRGADPPTVVVPDGAKRSGGAAFGR
jgi:hypothetical protein